MPLAAPIFEKSISGDTKNRSYRWNLITESKADHQQWDTHKNSRIGDYTGGYRTELHFSPQGLGTRGFFRRPNPTIK